MLPEPRSQMLDAAGGCRQAWNHRRHHDGVADVSFVDGHQIAPGMKLPIAEILEQIAVERDVRQALSEHRGVLGTLLALLDSFDNDDAASCDRLLSGLPGGFDRHTLNTCLSVALRWFNRNGEGSG